VSLQNHTAELNKQGFLAAIGAELSEVKRFPLIYLEQAGFLPVNNTEYTIQIDGKDYSLKKIPVEVNGVKCYKTVYSLNTQPFFWNEECNADFPYHEYNGQANDIINGINYAYNNNSGYPEIRSIEYQLPNKKMSVTFSPSLPDLGSLKEGVEISGAFSINVNLHECVIGGSYTVELNNSEILLQLSPKEGWQPMPGKSWVSFYNYEAHFDISKKTDYHFQSVWSIKQ
jgi:hypothetical protein